MSQRNGRAVGGRRGRAGAAAVTLIELLIALGLVGIVMAVAGTILLQAFANEQTYRQQNTAQTNARAAVDALSDDLRGAKKNSISPGSLAYTSPLSFRIYYDDGTERSVFYWLNGATLMRKVAATTVTGPASASDGIAVATGITSANSTLATVTGSTATVDLTATIGASAVEVTTTVGLRNLLLPL
jgi:type II secretory pathway pseudopilin PulG